MPDREETGDPGESLEGVPGEEASEEEWPVLSELELDVCVSDFVPSAELAHADTDA
jgi:hypothetical protein